MPSPSELAGSNGASQWDAGSSIILSESGSSHVQPFLGLLAGVLQVTCYVQSFTNEEEMRRGFVGGAEPDESPGPPSPGQ